MSPSAQKFYRKTISIMGDIILTSPVLFLLRGAVEIEAWQPVDEVEYLDHTEVYKRERFLLLPSP